MEKVIVIVGPTGVGKTSLSIALAKAINGEIISGDAYQCYKEMNIGSAKIKEEEKQGIPHYLIDYVSYKEEYNVKMFQEAGRKYIKQVLEKGKVPIVCGGTGLYIKALLYDYHFEEEELDEEYQKQLQEIDNQELYHLLQKVDEKACATIHPNNRKRIIRALMMAHAGMKKSERIEMQEHKPLYDVYSIGLTMERAHLYERINHRVEIMIEEGLEKEILSLVQKESDFQLQSMRGIGYKEWIGYYREEASLEETIALIQKNSRNFAKRQYTWFNNQMPIHWYDVEKVERESIIKEVINFLEADNEG